MQLLRCLDIPAEEKGGADMYSCQILLLVF